MRWMARLILTVVMATSVAQADWPQFHGPTRDSKASGETLARTWPEGGPEVLWALEMGEGFGGPAIRDGQVFLLDRQGDQDVLRCLDLTTGQQNWQLGYDAPGKVDFPGSRSTPAVGEKVIVTIGPFGHVQCVDRDSREVLWSKHLIDDYQGKRPRWGVSQSALLYGDWVILAPLGREAGLVALRADTGQEVWRSDSAGPMAYDSPKLVTLDGVEQLVILSNDRAVGVDPASGQTLWTYNGWRCNIPIPGPVAVDENRLFLTGGYKAGSAMIRVTGAGEGWNVEELFKTSELNAQIHEPLVIDEHLYANGNANENRDGLVCMDLDGNRLWTTGRNPNFDRGNLIYADGLLLVLDGARGTLHLVEPSPAGYNELARADVLAAPKKQAWGAMAISDGKLLVRDQQQLKCLVVGDPADE